MDSWWPDSHRISSQKPKVPILNSHCKWATNVCWFQTGLPRCGKMFRCSYNPSRFKSELSWAIPLFKHIQAIHQIKHQLRNSSPRLPVDRVTFFASASIIVLACGAVAPLGLKDCRRKSNCTQLLPDLRWSSGPAFQIFQISWQGPAGNYQKSLAAGQGNLVLQSTIAMFLRQRNF